MAGGGVAALKEQIGAKQDSFEAFLLKMDQQFEWLRKKLDPNGEIPYPLGQEDDSSSTPPLLPDLELKEIKMEVDLKHKDNMLIEVSKEPKSKVSKFGSSMLIIEDSGDRMIEKIDDSHSNSIGIIPTKVDYSENMDLGVLNPLGNGSILVQKLLYSKCNNYNAKEPLDDGISKVIEYRTIAFEEDDFMLHTENAVTIDAYTLTALQCKEKFRIVPHPSGVSIINNMSPTSYMKMQLILNLIIFFPVVFDPGGMVGLAGSLHFNP